MVQLSVVTLSYHPVQMKKFLSKVKRNSKFITINEKCENLKSELEILIDRNVFERRSICDLLVENGETEKHIIDTLKAEVSGPVICALNSLLPELNKLNACEQRLEENLQSWAVLKSQLVEYNALWLVIAKNRSTWDIVDEIEECPVSMRELVDLQLKIADQLLLRYRMIKLRTEQMKKVIPHLGAPWPKIAEIEAIRELADVVRFQTSCLKHAIQFFDAENQKRAKYLTTAAKKLRQLEKLDKFGEQRGCLYLKQKSRPVTPSNLHIWMYSPLNFKQSALEQEAANLHVWKFLGGSEGKLISQIVTLVQQLMEVEKRQVEVQTRLDELEQIDQQLKKMRNERNLLQHELNRNRKFLTQIMLEKMVHQNTRLKNLLVNSDYPESADSVVQELVQKNVELTNKVQELQEVVKYSRDDAGKHQDRSRAIINSLNNAINSLEEVAVEFVLHEQTDQNLKFKLRAIVEKERMHSLMSKLNEDDLKILQDSLQRGNVGEVLIHLTEDLGRQRDRFCKLLDEMGTDGLNVAIQGLSTTQMTALSEAVAAERLETATEILQSAKTRIGLGDPVAQEDQVTELVAQLQHLLSKLESTASIE